MQGDHERKLYSGRQWDRDGDRSIMVAPLWSDTRDLEPGPPRDFARVANYAGPEPHWRMRKARFFYCHFNASICGGAWFPADVTNGLQFVEHGCMHDTNLFGFKIDPGRIGPHATIGWASCILCPAQVACHRV